MPKTYKRKYKRKRKTYKPSPSTVMGPLRNVQKAKFIYQDSFTVNPGIALMSQQVFAANGLFDPSITSVGTQPRGFDQLMTMYDHYLVTKAKMQVWVNCSEGGANGALLTVLSVRDQPGTIVSYKDVLEYRYIKVMSANFLTKQGGTVTIECNPNRFLGYNNPRNEKELQGNIAANPVEQAYFHVHTGTIDEGNDLGPIHYQVRIEYEAILLEPKKLTAS